MSQDVTHKSIISTLQINVSLKEFHFLLGLFSVFAYVKREMDPGDYISKSLQQYLPFMEQPIVMPRFREIN